MLLDLVALLLSDAGGALGQTGASRVPYRGGGGVGGGGERLPRGPEEMAKSERQIQDAAFHGEVSRMKACIAQLFPYMGI